MQQLAVANGKRNASSQLGHMAWQAYCSSFSLPKSPETTFGSLLEILKRSQASENRKRLRAFRSAHVGSHQCQAFHTRIHNQGGGACNQGSRYHQTMRCVYLVAETQNVMMCAVRSTLEEPRPYSIKARIYAYSLGYCWRHQSFSERHKNIRLLFEGRILILFRPMRLWSERRNRKRMSFIRRWEK